MQSFNYIGKSLTNSSVPFSFFSVACCDTTVSFGPASLNNCIAVHPVTMVCLCICAYVYMKVYIDIYVYVCMYVYIYMNNCIAVHPLTMVYIYVYMYICVYVYIYVYIFIYTYMYLYIYVYLYTHKFIHIYRSFNRETVLVLIVYVAWMSFQWQYLQLLGIRRTRKCSKVLRYPQIFVI
jgi:hypothetical protein